MGLARSLFLVSLPFCDSSGFFYGGCIGFQVVVVGFDCCTSGDCCEELVFVAEFWWKVGCVGLLERETKMKREEREIEEKREKHFFYIISLYSLYYFNELYVKIETRM